MKSIGHKALISEKLYALACESIPGGVNSGLRNTSPHLVIRSAQGAILTDVDGNESIDYHGAFGPALLGHNHPAVRQRVIEALETNLLAGVGTSELEIAVAQKLSASTC